MHVDYLTLACLKHDLERFRDARIQGLLFTDESTLAMELYAGTRATLLVDVSARHARAHLQEEKARRGLETETPLLLLLRKHVRGGRLRTVTQPPGERILNLEIESETGRCTLVAEIMGRSSNLLLLDEAGTVMECVRRVGASQNSYRVTLPNHPYQLPPPLLKPLPHTLDEAAWRALLAGASADEPLPPLLVRALSGVSPTLARELATRATGNHEATVAEAEPLALLDAADELFAPLDTGRWAPHVALDEEGAVIAFAPYELTQFESYEPAASISEAMQRYLATQLDSDAYAAARRRVAEVLASAQKQVDSLLYQLRSQTVDEREIERLRENGELLLAYQWQVPKRADTAELPDFEGNPRRIPLDPALTAVENAQKYFARYDKKKRAAEEVPPRIEVAEQDAAFLHALATDLHHAEERPEIDAVRETLAASGFIKKKRRRAGGGVVRGPRRLLLGEWVALVGRNSQQNDEVTFRLGGTEDLWLHARGVPGSHVILKSAGREVPPEVIEQAAALAAYYSQARGSTEVAVDVTERRHVRRLSGARPGLVSYRNERTLHVKPHAGEDDGA